MVEQLTNQYTPNYAVAPGEVLQDHLDFYGMSQTELASRLGLSKKTVNEIIKGKAPIQPDTAVNLEKVFKRPAHFWANLERIYQERLARLNEQKRLRDHLDWLKEVPVRAMVERHFIQGHKDKLAQLNEVLSFFGVASPDQWQEVWKNNQVAYRQSQQHSTNAVAVSAWLRQGEIQAQQIDCAVYDKGGFSEVLGEIRNLTREEPEVFQPRLTELCADSGVAVVFVPELPKTGISGATRWMNGKPLIQLSLRYKSNDQLWFTFFHEAGHILKHGRKEIFLEGKGMGSDKEEEANRFARDTLIPPQRWKEFSGLFGSDQVGIKKFANSINIAPGIVVGRLQHEGLLARNQGNKLKVFYQWTKQT